jgi:Lon protease-like protein
MYFLLCKPTFLFVCSWLQPSNAWVSNDVANGWRAKIAKNNPLEGRRREFNRVRQGSNSCQALRKPSLQEQEDDNVSLKNRLILPIFPLRKSVRVPTDTLSLNLYEPRYLALADYARHQGSLFQQKQGISRSDYVGKARQSSFGIFGACYCSSKSQVVQSRDNNDNRSGMAAVVTPMLEVGDVGVVCHILDYKEGTTVTTNARKLSLKALAVERFRIEKILCNGYGVDETKTTCDNRDTTESDTLKNAPFILVEASRFRDDQEEKNTALDLENELRKADSAMIDLACVEEAKKLLGEDQHLHDGNVSDRDQRNELKSFAMISAISNQFTTIEMDDQLRELSTVSRLKTVEQYRQQQWLNRIQELSSGLLDSLVSK